MKYIKLSGVSGILSVMLLTGCGNLSGLNGETKFACKAPAGVTCNSLSGVYSNSIVGNLPVQQQNEKKGSSNRQPIQEGKSKRYVGFRAVPETGMPVRSQPEVARVWLAPWESNEGHLYDQSYVYLVVGEGRWEIEHNRERLIQEFRTTRLLGSESRQDSDKKVKNGTKSEDETILKPFMPERLIGGIGN